MPFAGVLVLVNSVAVPTQTVVFVNLTSGIVSITTVFEIVDLQLSADVATNVTLKEPGFVNI